jgi:hypothetical protein
MTETPGREDGIDVERRSPDGVFALLGDDIRIDIVRALGETPDEAVPFAVLQERAGVRDSGQFNYHLGKLRGVFVRKTDDGYELTYAGRQVVGAMYAGTYTATASIESIPVEGACPMCDGEVVASYAEETARVDCTDCGEWRNEFPFPPGSLDQFAPGELPAAFDRWMRHVYEGVVAGFCYTCAGRMEGHLVVDEGDGIGGMPAHAAFECVRCGSGLRSSGASPALLHPAVQGFLYDHGFDVRTAPSWLLGEVGLPETTLLSEEPPRLAVTLSHEGASIRAVVEADASVSEVERSPETSE